ncbi:MAG: cyclic nucleotide-binding domain-containing protein [Alphaproteobacteria bacterium]|nr:cyclic nucleotide-binding domain-containing protein [Alphaproteobacteria bacterium]MDD9920226.1 cyclic nucleotide-binding domain-containing protein [Alphaproteobacteria bacterium]
MLDKIISSLSPEESKTIEQIAHAKLAPRGQVLMEEGDVARDLFFLIDGEVTIYQSAVLAKYPCALELAHLKAPLLLGEANLFRATERSASILVTADTHYLHLPYESLEKLKSDHPKIYNKLLEYAGAVVSQRMVDLQQNMQRRLIVEATDLRHALLNLKRYFGGATPCSPELAQKLFSIKQPDIKKEN